MKIDIIKIEIHNFMSFADEIFDFSEQHGMNLVTGKNLDIPNSKNGAGKSTVFSALLWGLYGQLSNKVKAENISNRYIEDKDVRVVVYLNIDNKKYKVATGLNKRAQSYFNIYSIEDEQEKDLTKSSITESRQYFENDIIHCDISLFLRTILLTSEQNYNFFNLKKQDKKDFIEKLFDIGLFGNMYDRIHKDVLTTEKSVVLHQNQLAMLQNNINDYNDRIEKFKQQQENEKKEIDQKINSTQLLLEELQKNTVKKNTELISKYEEANKKLFDAKFKINEQMANKKIQIQKVNSDISANQRIRIDRKQILDKHTELLDKLCKDCKKIFDKYHNLSTYKNDMDKADNNIQSLKSQIEKEKEQYAQLQQKFTDICDKMDKAQCKLKELNSESDKAKLKQTDTEKQLGILKSNLDSIIKKVNPYIELLQNTKEKIENETVILEKESEQYKYLKKAEEIVSQDSLKKFIIKDLIGIINNKIKTYLMKMGAKYTCIFDENLDYDFMTESGSCELQNFSCGEKKRLEIATCLSFRDFIAQRSNISSNILILDEYIDSGIDTLAVESILQILKEFTISSKQNIFIISHRSEVNNDIFDRIIELQKKNGISTIHYL